MTQFVDQLPVEYKGKPQNKMFRMPDKRYGSVDTYIRSFMTCNDCDCWLRTPKDKFCTRCKSTDLKLKFQVSKCHYYAGRCRVIGCGVHPVSSSHSPVCMCEECQ